MNRMNLEVKVKMGVVKTIVLSVLVLVAGLNAFSFFTLSDNKLIPVTGNPGQSAAVNESSFISLEDFNRGIRGGNPGVIRGVYVEDVLALRVVQQPSDDPAFVSSAIGTATQFGMAGANGVTGLLAHNYASGDLFSKLEDGHKVHVSYGDGTVKDYRVNRILRFQALEPNNPHSDFVNLETGEKLTAAGLFSQVYTGGHRVTFQTCIQKGDEDAWGRLFIMAEPA